MEEAAEGRKNGAKGHHERRRFIRRDEASAAWGVMAKVVNACSVSHVGFKAIN